MQVMLGSHLTQCAQHYQVTTADLAVASLPKPLSFVQTLLCMLAPLQALLCGSCVAARSHLNLLSDGVQKCLTVLRSISIRLQLRTCRER